MFDNELRFRCRKGAVSVLMSVVRTRQLLQLCSAALLLALAAAWGTKEVEVRAACLAACNGGHVAAPTVGRCVACVSVSLSLCLCVYECVFVHVCPWFCT